MQNNHHVPNYIEKVKIEAFNKDFNVETFGSDNVNDLENNDVIKLITNKLLELIVIDINKPLMKENIKKKLIYPLLYLLYYQFYPYIYSFIIILVLIFVILILLLIFCILYLKK